MSDQIVFQKKWLLLRIIDQPAVQRKIEALRHQSLVHIAADH